MADNVSQKILVNMDTSMSLGRMYAQAAHASMLAILKQGSWEDNNFTISCDKKPELLYWMKYSFTKVMLRIWGEDKILSILEKVKTSNIPYGLMEEDGFITALAVGPYLTSEIDKIIGKHPLM